MKQTNKKKMQTLLIELESELKRLGFWDKKMPDCVKNRHSTIPFAVDVLEPQQWLQWIFIVRLHHILETNGELPLGYALSPYFEEAFKEQDSGQLLSIISEIDQLGKIHR